MSFVLKISNMGDEHVLVQYESSTKAREIRAGDTGEIITDDDDTVVVYRRGSKADRDNKTAKRGE